MPPKAAAEAAVLAFTEGAALGEEELPPAGAEVPGELAELVELELLQPAASKMDPTAATAATIVLDARK
jgi:hypothetical protein